MMGSIRLASLAQRLVLVAQAVESTPVLDVQARIFFVHPAIIQVHKGRLRPEARGLRQDGDLLDLFVGGAAVSGLPVKARIITIKLPLGWGLARPTFPPNSRGLQLLPLEMHPTSGACQL